MMIRCSGKHLSITTGILCWTTLVDAHLSRIIISSQALSIYLPSPAKPPFTLASILVQLIYLMRYLALVDHDKSSFLDDSSHATAGHPLALNDRYNCIVFGSHSFG